MKQTMLIPLDKLPEGFSSTGQTLVDQSLVSGSVHDHRLNERSKLSPEFPRFDESGGRYTSPVRSRHVCFLHLWSGLMLEANSWQK